MKEEMETILFGDNDTFVSEITSLWVPGWLTR